METIIALFAQFKTERRYLTGVTNRTIELYEQAFEACRPALPETLGELTPTAAKRIPVYLAETPTAKGQRSPVGINIYLRVFNAFFRWLHTEHGHTLIRLPSIKVEKRIMPTYSADHIQRIIDYRPTGMNDLRVKALWVLAIDTGCRIHELLALTRDKLNLEQCTLTVFGKGRKERVVPFSAEARKALYAWLKTHARFIVFSTRAGIAMSSRNAARDLRTLLSRLRLEPPKRLWHSTRRTFGTTYIRNGGDVFRLQQTLGHSNLETTRRYVEIDIDDLRNVHASLSPLKAVRR